MTAQGHRFKQCLFLPAALMAISTVQAQSLWLDPDEERRTPDHLLLPYVFYTDALQLTFGGAAGAGGLIQEQANLFATAFGTTNGSRAMLLFASDLRVPGTDRLFVDAGFSIGFFDEQRIYQDADTLGDPPAGSNDSDSMDFLSGEGRDDWLDLRFRYVLPIGTDGGAPIPVYRLRNGLLLEETATGGDGWNPLENGRAFATVSAFSRQVTVELAPEEAVFDTNGLRFGLEWDNRDFPNNPTRGAFYRARLSRDFGLLDSNDTWTTIEAEATHYFTLPTASWMRQNVLAFNVWTVDTPTWSERPGTGGTTIAHRPPFYEGATLGGFHRMRGFPNRRFNEKAAVYYCAEWRFVPDWNPLRGIALLDPLEIDWIQFVPFVEVGRVADTWSVDELHRDLKYDVGMGFRMMARKAIFRLDIAVSEETWGMWAMVGHPFDRR